MAAAVGGPAAILDPARVLAEALAALRPASRPPSQLACPMALGATTDGRRLADSVQMNDSGRGNGLLPRRGATGG